MDRFEATVTSKGQVTLPARLRSALGIKSGDKLVFHRDEDGAVRLDGVTAGMTETLADLGGIVRRAPVPVDGQRIARWIEESRGARWASR